MKKLLPEHAIVIPDNATRVFRGQIFDVYQWPQIMYDGSTATFEMLRRPDTLQVIAVKDGQLVMVHDEQPNRASRLHFPGGRADHDDETWLHGAQRELLEETGLSFKNWKLIAVEQPLGKIEHFVPWFVATDLVAEVPQQLDSGEKITVELMTFDAVRAKIFDPENAGMSYALPLFTRFPSLAALLKAPVFHGKEVDR